MGNSKEDIGRDIMGEGKERQKVGQGERGRECIQW